MPAQRFRSSAGGVAPAADVPLNGHYPKFLVSDTGNVWLITAPKTGVLLVKNREPFRNKTVGVGYMTSKLKEGRGLSPYHGTITIHVDR
jgi:hypothetical protein